MRRVQRTVDAPIKLSRPQAQSPLLRKQPATASCRQQSPVGQGKGACWTRAPTPTLHGRFSPVSGVTESRLVLLLYLPSPTWPPPTGSPGEALEELAQPKGV